MYFSEYDFDQGELWNVNMDGCCRWTLLVCAACESACPSWCCIWTVQTWKAVSLLNSCEGHHHMCVTGVRYIPAAGFSGPFRGWAFLCKWTDSFSHVGTCWLAVCSTGRYSNRPALWQSVKPAVSSDKEKTSCTVGWPSKCGHSPAGWLSRQPQMPSLCRQCSRMGVVYWFSAIAA